MRRWFVVGICLALALASGTAAIAGPRHVRGDMIVCPEHPGITTCCGPPVTAPDQTVCCPLPTSIGCAPSLSINATPNPAIAGRPVTISGVLTGGSGTIVLWQRLPGGGWRRAGNTSTGTGGAYSIALSAGRVMTNRSWYATGGGVQSATIGERVAARVTLAGSGGSHPAVHGRVIPSHAGEHVFLQMRRRGRWVRFMKLALDRRSRFAAGFPSVPRLGETVRAVLPADARNIRSLSATTALR